MIFVEELYLSGMAVMVFEGHEQGQFKSGCDPQPFVNDDDRYRRWRLF